MLLLAIAAVTLFAVFDRSELVFEPVNGSAAVSFTHDKTALPDFVYNASALTAAQVYAIRSVDEHYIAPEDTDLSFLGTVGDIYYTFIAGEAWTQSDVRVDEVRRGKLSEGDIISVYSPGGFASMEDYEAAHGKGKYSESGAGYIEFLVNERPHPQFGDNRVFFVNKLPSDSPLPKGAYAEANVGDEAFEEKRPS